MMKKIVCLLLSLLLMVPVLASCGKEDAIDAINEEASRYTTTLNVWVITESNTDPAQAKAVNDAINKLTKSKYKTQLNIKYLTEDAYYGAVEAAFEEHIAYLANNSGKTNKKKSEESFLNEYGIPELKYPEIPDCEVDILFINNYEKYRTYVNNGWLSDLTDQMGEAALKLTYYVNGAFLELGEYKKSIYAIANNHRIGDYTYLAMDKTLLAEYGDLTGASIYDSAFQSYLDYIYTNHASAENKVYPLYSETGKVDVDFTNYWNFDVENNAGAYIHNPTEFSIFGDNYLGKTILGNKNLLADSTYMKSLAAKTKYENTPEYITSDPDAKAAVRVLRGGAETVQQIDTDQYEVFVMINPQIMSEDIFNSMFAVGKHTADLTRSMEIITYLNTNAEIRNLLQYGIEGINYSLETATVNGKEYTYAASTAENGYHMNIANTGNQFIAYPNSAESAYRASYDSKQNMDAVKYPAFGLYFDLSKYTPDEQSIRIIDAVSEKVKTYLDGLTRASEVLSVQAIAAAKAGDNDQMAAFLLSLTGSVEYTMNGTTTAVTAENLSAALTCATTEAIDKSDGAVQSPYAIYLAWCSANGIKDPDAQE